MAIDELFVEQGSTKTGWHINVHYVEILDTHMECEVKHNGDVEKRHLWLKKWVSN